MQDQALLGSLAALGSSFTWALGITAYSKLAEKHSPFVINFTRGWVGLPLFFLAAWIWGGSGWSVLSGNDFFWFFIAQIASYGLGDACFMYSALWMGVPGALAIGSIYPMWSALVDVVFNGRVLSILGYVGLLLCVGGTVLVILTGQRAAGRRSRSNDPFRKTFYWGVAGALITSGFWSLNTVAISKINPEISSFVANTLRSAMSVLLCGALARIFYPRASLSLGKASYRAFGPVILLEVFVGSSVFLYGLSHAPLAVAAALSALAPVIAAPIAWIRGSDEFHWGKLVGIVSVVSGVVLLVGLG